MPSKVSIYNFIKKKFDEIELDPDHYTLGDEYKEDSDALFDYEGYWYVGGNERGKHTEEARFKHPIDAAEYLIFIKYKSSHKPLPQIDWTEYASLP
jgi:hypothetical protein